MEGSGCRAGAMTRGQTAAARGAAAPAVGDAAAAPREAAGPAEVAAALAALRASLPLEPLQQRLDVQAARVLREGPYKGLARRTRIIIALQASVLHEPPLVEALLRLLC